MKFRKPTGDETRLLCYLAARSDGSVPDGWMDGLLVEPMEDGGMGSLRLMTRGAGPRDEKFGRVLSACQFDDSDGVKVVATLYANSVGLPFELDVWKVDFSPLHSIALEFEWLPGA